MQDIFWVKAFIIGAIKLTWLNLFGEHYPTIIGTCMPNGLGDLEKANKLRAKYYRLTLSEALKLKEGDLKHPYCLLMENIKGEGPIAKTDNDNLKMVFHISRSYPFLKTKPDFIMCQNEQNEISHYMANSVRQSISYDKILCPIVKGPHTNVVESAAREKYYQYLKGHKAMNYRKDFPHVLNYYEKPYWEKKYFQNFVRRSHLTYVVTKLNKMGYKNIYITEAHDGSTTRPGYAQTHGLGWYASKKGWDNIVKLCKLLKIKAVMHYQAPFLGMKGNTILSGENDT